MLVRCDRPHCGGTLLDDVDELVCLLCGERVWLPTPYEQYVRDETARARQDLIDHPIRRGPRKGTKQRSREECQRLPYPELQRQLRLARIEARKFFVGAAS